MGLFQSVFENKGILCNIMKKANSVNDGRLHGQFFNCRTPEALILIFQFRIKIESKHSLVMSTGKNSIMDYH